MNDPVQCCNEANVAVPDYVGCGPAAAVAASHHSLDERMNATHSVLGADAREQTVSARVCSFVASVLPIVHSAVQCPNPQSQTPTHLVSIGP